jgi:hypothetical protein
MAADIGDDAMENALAPIDRAAAEPPNDLGRHSHPPFRSHRQHR